MNESCKEEDDEIEADNKADGSITSATATNTGAEKIKKDIIIVIKKKTVRIPLKTRLLLSSFRNKPNILDYDYDYM